jgi:hypothetical protein
MAFFLATSLLLRSSEAVVPGMVTLPSAGCPPLQVSGVWLWQRGAVHSGEAARAGGGARHPVG